ncbi:MAG: arginine repressor [Candidatus Latescibacteria bacterium]|nr:arginine repressor [Candidatus Latescibacterota bacterium]
MTEKQKRQQKIIELISAQPIARQEALSDALKAVGIETTQSTLSKDIKELGVMKAPDGTGGFQYQMPSFGEPVGRASLKGEALLRRELRDFVVLVDGAGYTAVVKTATGHAQGVCEVIDQVSWPEVVGTLAGENTIFILCRSEVDCRRLRDRIEEMVP